MIQLFVFLCVSHSTQWHVILLIHPVLPFFKKEGFCDCYCCGCGGGAPVGWWVGILAGVAYS